LCTKYCRACVRSEVLESNMDSHQKNKIFFIFHGRFPSEKAHALFVAESCEAFARKKCDVTLLVPNRKVAKDIREKFDTSGTYRIVYLPTFDGLRFGFMKKIFFLISYLIFSLYARSYIRRHAQEDDLVYTNEYLPLLFLGPQKRNCLEIHDLPHRHLWFYKRCYKNASHILFTNRWKKVQFEKIFPDISAKLFVELNAVDVAQFDITATKEEARDALSIPQEQKIALYTGHLYEWKGVDTFAETAKQLPDIDAYFVGGTDADRKQFARKYDMTPNIHIVGLRPHSEMPLWQRAADVLVLPNTAKQDISKYYTSPMKLFEYMASGTPIVASDIPSIREIVASNKLTFVAPDDPNELAKKIQKIIKNSENTNDRCVILQELAREHSWEARATRIMQIVN